MQAAPTKFASSFKMSGTTYANALGGNANKNTLNKSQNVRPNQRPRANEVFGRIESDCVKYLGKDIVTCMDRIGDFAEEYSSYTSGADKTRALWGLLISLRLDA